MATLAYITLTMINHLESIGKQLNFYVKSMKILYLDMSLKVLRSLHAFDLILRNRPSCFQNSTILDIVISDFHKLTITMMKTNFRKQEPIIMNYRNYKSFKNDFFQNELLYEISKYGFRGMYH